MTDSERITDVIKYYKMNKSAFARYIGLSSPQIIYDIINGRNGISKDLAEKITTSCVNIDKAWLLADAGSMLLPDLDSTRAKEIGDFINIPLITVRAKAGYLTGFGDMEYIETLPTFPVIVDKTYKGRYRCFEVDGDSMDDGTRQAVCDKDIVLGREVKRELWKSKLHIRDWNFIIVHKDGITIKRISEHDTEKGIIKCHSLNPLYDDFELHLDNVIELYNLIKTVDRSGKL